jgi:hypothetical protein
MRVIILGVTVLACLAAATVFARDSGHGDTVTIYAVWNIDVKDLFGIFK